MAVFSATMSRESRDHQLPSLGVQPTRLHHSDRGKNNPNKSKMHIGFMLHCRKKIEQMRENLMATNALEQNCPILWIFKSIPKDLHFVVCRIKDYSFQHFRNSVQGCYCIVLKLFGSPSQWEQTSSLKGDATDGCYLMHAYL